MKKLAVYFDGTWNTPVDRTNVYKLYKLTKDVDATQQQATYIHGVGTEKGGVGLIAAFRNFLGGAFGDGLSKNICDGYEWLIQRYEDGDQIFLFGFSRGAYTARSLAGLIRNCGVLRPESIDQVGAAYGIYRDHQPPDSDSTVEFRRRHSRVVAVDFIGVWDTVGSLGIPVTGLDLPGFKRHYQFHDTHLSDNTRAAYHALAVNEYREPYAPTLWTPKTGKVRELPVEQRWFIGAHSNVGGGYSPDLLCNPPCLWIQEMAIRHGLEFFSPWPMSVNDHEALPRNSYDEFVKEHQSLKAVVKAVARSVGTGINETIDDGAKAALRKRPELLGQYPEMRAALLDLPTTLGPAVS